jgi:small multidrug resistance pump
VIGYIYLIFALIGELIGTVFLKHSDGFSKLLPSAMVVAAYSLSFFFISKALLFMKLSVVYATWSAVGIIGATSISIFLYKEESVN